MSDEERTGSEVKGSEVRERCGDTCKNKSLYCYNSTSSLFLLPPDEVNKLL